jgi:hypothetical protein
MALEGLASFAVGLFRAATQAVTCVRGRAAGTFYPLDRESESKESNPSLFPR